MAVNNFQNALQKTKFGFRDFISLLNCFSLFAFIFKKFGKDIAPKMVRKEKFLIPAGINDVSLKLFANFFEDFEKSLENRRKLALFFQEELKKLNFEVQESKDNVFAYLSVLIPKELENKRDELVNRLKKENIFCTRMWHSPIVLNEKVQKEYQINLSEFPETLDVAKRIINFPLQNYYTEKDVKTMVDKIKKALLIL